MAIEVIMPRLTHDMDHGVLVKWLKKEGDSVSSGDVIFEVETDKAISEVPAETGGFLRGLRFRTGDEIPIGTIMAYILHEHEDLPETSYQIPARTLPTEHSKIAVKSNSGSISSDMDNKKFPRVIATPIAKCIAREHNLHLDQISGTGPLGRIIEADVRAYLEQNQKEIRPLETFPSEVPFESIPLNRYQRTTGNRMVQSIQSAPHFVLEVDVDMTEAQQWREQQFQASEKRISFTAILVKVTAQALLRYPDVNASFNGDFIKRFQEVNIGLALATDQGLLVPVVRQADKYSVLQIQELINNLRAGAKQGRLSSVNLTGGTFTISNLGMYGIDCFQAIINPPEAAILAVGKIRDRPWSINQGVDTRPIMNLRLSIDHRVIDGAKAAPFLVEIKSLLENPYLLL